MDSLTIGFDGKVYFVFDEWEPNIRIFESPFVEECWHFVTMAMDKMTMN